GPEFLYLMCASERTEPRGVSELCRLAMPVKAAAEQQIGEQHGEQDGADEAQPPFGGGANHKSGVAVSEKPKRQDEAGQNEEEHDGRGAIDRCKADAAKQCRRRIEALDDPDARRIERPKEVPGDDHKSCKSTQRLELHDLAVSGRRCGGCLRAGQRVVQCDRQMNRPSVPAANLARNLTAM